MIPLDPALDGAGLPPRRRPSRWPRRALLFVAGLLLLDALLGDRGLAATFRARDEYRRAAADVAALTRENVALREQARRLRQDGAAIEAVARRDLGLIRRGEILIVVRDVPAGR